MVSNSTASNNKLDQINEELVEFRENQLLLISELKKQQEIKDMAIDFDKSIFNEAKKGKNMKI